MIDIISLNVAVASVPSSKPAPASALENFTGLNRYSRYFARGFLSLAQSVSVRVLEPVTHAATLENFTGLNRYSRYFARGFLSLTQAVSVATKATISNTTQKLIQFWS